jgi:hypothetical protein
MKVTYNAVEVYEPGKLRVVERPVAEPGAGQVRIRVEACGNVAPTDHFMPGNSRQGKSWICARDRGRIDPANCESYKWFVRSIQLTSFTPIAVVRLLPRPSLPVQM